MSTRVASIIGAVGTGIASTAQEFVALACGISTLIILAPKVFSVLSSPFRKNKKQNDESEHPN